LGSISGKSARRQDTEFYFRFNSFVYPGSTFAFDTISKTLRKLKDSTVANLNPDLFETKQIFFDSLDGTKVPMFIVHKKGVVLNGDNPTLLYGYGGFNISMSPSYSTSRVLWMMHFNGVFALANIRGGDEYGEEWHKAGILEKKQNVFDDFQAAARALLQHKYTNPKNLGIMGGSNGGLLVAACANQAPELFGAVICQVGVLDMLRFHKFTIGWAWCSDYGSSDNPEHFKFLIKYSPLHTITKGKQYPAMLLCTADHDDRVVPLHSFKYTAELQHQVGGQDHQGNPLLIRIDTKAGHGRGKSLEKQFLEAADNYSFLGFYLGAKWVN